MWRTKIPTGSLRDVRQLLYDLFQTVRLSKESENDSEQFIFEIETEFLLSQLTEMDFKDEA